MDAVDSVAAARVEEFARAIARVNEWRGRMIENFARAEQAVSETLLLLVESGVAGAGTKLPHLTGQRFASLASVLSSLDNPLPHANSVVKELELFRRNEEWRIGLCHGVQKVAIERDGQWVTLIKVLVFKARSPSRSTLTIEEPEATRLLTQLNEDRRRLTSALGQLRKAVGRR